MKAMRLRKHDCLVLLLAVAVLSVLVPASAQAQEPEHPRWCYTEHPDAVFCEDFDQYCCSEYLGCTDGAGLPATPNDTCWPIPGAGCFKANGRAVEVWVPIECGAVINLDEHGDCGDGSGSSVTAPFGAKYPKGLQGNHNVNLGAYAKAHWGHEDPQINSVIGTDESPLVLEYVLNGQNFDKLHHANTFIDLAYIDGVNFIDHRAPTDYIFDDLCEYYDYSDPDRPIEIKINHPMICQQAVPPAGCPDILDAPHHGSIAIGAVANLDKNPCNIETHVPTNKHLAVFDGHKWWTLPAAFPHGGDFPFEIGDGYNQIRLELRSTTMRVELINDAGYHSWCEMPRDYQGPFNKLSLGFGQACLIDLDSWTCAKTPGTDRVYTCIPTVSLSKNHPYKTGPVYDNIALHGGEGHVAPSPIGACCLTNGGCIDDISEFECEMMNGGTWQGMATTCAETICCPDPFADADGDGDVDHVDFGLFQACFTGPGPVSPVPSGKCTCFDRSFWAEGDADVDDLDFADFEACFSGPTVPADPTCDDNLHM